MGPIRIEASEVAAGLQEIAADLRARAQRVIDWPMNYGNADARLSALKDALIDIDARARPLTPEETVAEVLDKDGQG